MERLAQRDVPFSWDRRSKAFAASGLTHLLILALMIFGPIVGFMWQDDLGPSAVQVRFWIPGGKGPGGGGGGGGSKGRRPTAYIPVRVETIPEPATTKEPRKAPVAPRIPKPLNFDSLTVPDLPVDTATIMDSPFSPDARDYPGLSLVDGTDYGGVDTELSSGTGGGIGGGSGTGTGSGEGWGVGPGRGGGVGGGEYAPGGFDMEPVVVYQPPEPAYPARAREKMVTGEVILQVLVKLDGSTEVLGVIKSLPFCVEAAKENARLWRWKPALKDGEPVEAPGVIIVKFELFAQKGRKS